jgi:hypothetical protein
MLGPKQEAQAALFYEFSLEEHVPQDHLLRSIDRFVDLSDIRQYLSEFYSQLAVHPSTPSYSSACCWWGIALASAQNAHGISACTLLLFSERN